MSVVLYSTDINKLKYWYECLNDTELLVYASSKKDEIFEYFYHNKKQSLLFIDYNEKDEEFLNFILRGYGHLKVAILTEALNIKEASKFLELGVDGYAHSYMKKLHLLSLVKAILEDKFWYYPEFTITFLGLQRQKSLKPVGKIYDIQNLILLDSEEEERIAVDGEDIFEGYTLTAPYESSKAKLSFNDGVRLALTQKTGVFFVDKSLFADDSLEDITVFDINKKDDIFIHLGVDKPKEKTRVDGEEKSAQKTAAYSGKLEEYDIMISKSMDGFLIIKDKIKGRDGSDLVNDKIEEFIFLDTKKSFKELYELKIS